MSLLTQASLILTSNAYKASKLYSIVPTSGNGDMTVARATTATRVNSSGVVESVAINVPRLNYATVGGCPSILLEPQRTNLMTHSQDFTNINWTKNSTSIVSTNNLSPNGTLTATRLGITDTSNPTLQQVITGTISASYTTSFWVRRISGTAQVYLRAGSLDPFNITLTSEWKLFTATGSSTTTTIRCGIGFLAPVLGTDVIEVWGAQLEQGAYPTSYIPTTTTALTRNADVLSRNNIFTNGLITASGGTWFVELDNNFALTRDAFSSSIALNTVSNNTGNGLEIRSSTGSSRLQIFKNTAGSGSSMYTTLTDKIKVALKWNGTTADFFVNGTKVVSATAFTETTMQFLNLSAQDVPKYIKSIMLFPTPLTDAECTSLTTL